MRRSDIISGSGTETETPEDSREVDSGSAGSSGITSNIRPGTCISVPSTDATSADQEGSSDPSELQAFSSGAASAVTPAAASGVGAGSPFAVVGLSDDLVCGMPFGELVAAMKKAGFSKELTAEGKAYRKRLKNRQCVKQYSNRKKAGSTTLSSQNDGLKVEIISLQKRNDELVSEHGRLNEELRLATVVWDEAIIGIEDLQAQITALQRAVATLTVASSRVD